MPWLARIPERHVHLAHTASAIADPLSRLRFLRATVPCATMAPWRARRGRRIAALLLPVPFLPLLLMRLPRTEPPPPPAPHRHVASPAETAQPVSVWQVEADGNSEVYSNGLRIDTRFTVAGPPRLYRVFARNSGISQTALHSQPAGIVFHTSESCQAPFAEDQTPVLVRLGEDLLQFVRRNHSYHYLIDRFGRVYRVVAESDVAYHAGHSVWADSDWLYLDLNRSFLGVSFEAQTTPGQRGGLASPAQLRTAAMLTEMLRSRYRIPAENCVTHAQVSVNPSNMLIGYHTDWAAGFPFAALGLPDNYQRALPALWAFGFSYEPVWFQSGSPLTAGIERAETEILRGAAAASMRPETYRKFLQKRYRERLAESRITPAGSPPDDIHALASPAAPVPPSPAIHKKMRPRALAEK
ncbi:MAG: peptidoglycan recognition family protein [Bryobacteraceae bacterium]|jgi:N-acetylmuramoyl-L-alanine amidase-like protein